MNVAPLVGAWIERLFDNLRFEKVDVAPLVGAWIERIHENQYMENRLCRSSCRSVD